MKIFISWSGNRSRDIAKALYWFLPRVMNSFDPWISCEDIAPGKRWSHEISEQLEVSKVGILCLTPENYSEPWLLFEAGALSKSISENNCVIPYFNNFKPTDINGPLTLFQGMQATKEDTRKIVEILYEMVTSTEEVTISREILIDSFNKYWVDFKAKIDEANNQSQVEVKKRPSEEILEEILIHVRSLIYNSNISPNTDDEFQPFMIRLSYLLDEMQSTFERYPYTPKKIISPIDYLKECNIFLAKPEQTVLNPKRAESLFMSYEKYIQDSIDIKDLENLSQE
jgi:hypothetical protein